MPIDRSRSTNGLAALLRQRFGVRVPGLGLDGSWLPALVRIGTSKLVGVPQDHLPLPGFEPVGLRAAKRPAVCATSDVPGHVLQVHRQRKLVADRRDDVLDTPVGRIDASGSPVDPGADLVPAALVSAEGAHDHHIVLVRPQRLERFWSSLHKLGKRPLAGCDELRPRRVRTAPASGCRRRRRLLPPRISPRRRTRPSGNAMRVSRVILAIRFSFQQEAPTPSRSAPSAGRGRPPEARWLGWGRVRRPRGRSGRLVGFNRSSKQIGAALHGIAAGQGANGRWPAVQPRIGQSAPNGTGGASRSLATPAPRPPGVTRTRAQDAAIRPGCAVPDRVGLNAGRTAARLSRATRRWRRSPHSCAAPGRPGRPRRG